MRAQVLRSIDKLDRVGLDGVRDLLGDGRKDDSGDFTRVELASTPPKSNRVLAFVSAGSAPDDTGRPGRFCGTARVEVLDRLGAWLAKTLRARGRRGTCDHRPAAYIDGP